MAPSVLYHCPCLASTTIPPPPNLPSSSYSFHPLHTLFFCEECDAIRCNRCVSVEVSSYYCPNCLFEVPSASVRAEKNRYSSQLRMKLIYAQITRVDVHEIASCVQTVATRFLLCLQIHRMPAMAECQYQLAHSTSHLFFSTATTADGTLQKLVLHSRNRPALLVSQPSFQQWQR